MQIEEKNNMPSGDTVNTQQEENSLLTVLSEQPTRPERSRQLSKPLKRLRTVPLASAHNSTRERRPSAVQQDAHQYGAAVWGSYKDDADSALEVLAEQHQFPDVNTDEMFEMTTASESATSWQWIYDGGDNGSSDDDDFAAGANGQSYQDTPPYPRTGPLPIMLEPASRRTAKERAQGSQAASSMLPLLVTLLIIGVTGVLVCQYLLTFYR